MKDAEYIVQTEQGNRGRTRNSDHLVNGKIVVYLEDKNHNPILETNGQQKKILVDRLKIKIIGYVN